MLDPCLDIWGLFLIVMISNFPGETKECTEFAKQFLERRSKYKNQQRAQNAHIDDMCSPAPAINPSSNDFQEVKVCIIHGVLKGKFVWRGGGEERGSILSMALFWTIREN